MPSHISVFIKGKGYLVVKATDTNLREQIESYEVPRCELDRFLSYVDQCERLDLCWNWAADKWGMYGRFNNQSAHRWLYSLLFGPIPAKACNTPHLLQRKLRESMPSGVYAS